MFTHTDIWRGIDRLASEHGFSASGLAKRAGLDPTAFNRSKRTSPEGKPRWPSTESISKILAVTNASMSDFIALIQSESSTQKSVSIAVIGFAQAGENGYFDEDGYPEGDSWDDVVLPHFHTKANEKQYALKVSGDSMHPLYRNGDVLVVCPSESIRKGDRIIVKTNEGEVLAKELIQKSTKKITLRSLNSAYEDRVFKPTEIHWMARIIWTSQ